MKIRLVAKTQPLIEGMTLEEYIVYVARVSNDTQEQRERKQGVERLLRHMLENKHESPFDFVDFAFEVETSRDIGRQYLRHRTCAFQEHSQRYSDKVEFEPIELRKQSESNRQGGEEIIVHSDILGEGVQTLLETIDATYKSFIGNGVAKECARGILPGCTRTSMVVKNNVRNWLNILDIRLNKDAQKEAREIANLIYEELKKHIPFIIKVWEERFTHYQISMVIQDVGGKYDLALDVVKTLKEAKAMVKHRQELELINSPNIAIPTVFSINSIGIGGPDVVNFREVYNA